MYCPKCSQQQSGEMRFCSRCGFPLAGVALVLDNNGMLPPVVAEATPGRNLTRNRVLGESAILTLISWMLALVATAWFDYSGALESVAKIAAAIFFILGLIGLARFVYGFLFFKELPAASAILATPSASSEITAPAQVLLPAQQSTPISDYPRRVNTREMAQRPSVTEGTTRLLDD